MKCGYLEAGFAYDLPTRTLTVHVLQARDVPTKEQGGPPNTQVRMKSEIKNNKIHPGQSGITAIHN